MTDKIQYDPDPVRENELRKAIREGLGIPDCQVSHYQPVKRNIVTNSDRSAIEKELQDCYNHHHTYDRTLTQYVKRHDYHIEWGLLYPMRPILADGGKVVQGFKTGFEMNLPHNHREGNELIKLGSRYISIPASTTVADLTTAVYSVGYKSEDLSIYTRDPNDITLTLEDMSGMLSKQEFVSPSFHDIRPPSTMSGHRTTVSSQDALNEKLKWAQDYAQQQVFGKFYGPGSPKAPNDPTRQHQNHNEFCVSCNAGFPRRCKCGSLIHGEMKSVAFQSLRYIACENQHCPYQAEIQEIFRVNRETHRRTIINAQHLKEAYVMPPLQSDVSHTTSMTISSMVSSVERPKRPVMEPTCPCPICLKCCCAHVQGLEHNADQCVNSTALQFPILFSRHK